MWLLQPCKFNPSCSPPLDDNQLFLRLLGLWKLLPCNSPAVSLSNSKLLKNSFLVDKILCRPLIVLVSSAFSPVQTHFLKCGTPNWTVVQLRLCHWWVEHRDHLIYRNDFTPAQESKSFLQQLEVSDSYSAFIHYKPQTLSCRTTISVISSYFCVCKVDYIYLNLIPHTCSHGITDYFFRAFLQFVTIILSSNPTL